MPQKVHLLPGACQDASRSATQPTRRVCSRWNLSISLNLEKSPKLAAIPRASSGDPKLGLKEESAFPKLLRKADCFLLTLDLEVGNSVRDRQ